MSLSNGGNPRIDRIEAILETVVTVQRDMQQEHQMLLRAQVVQGEELRELSKKTDERFRALATSMQQMDERLTAAQERLDNAMTALMGTVDQFIRRRDRA